MRAALGEAIAAGQGGRLPELLFGQNGAPVARVYWLFVPSPRGYSVVEHTPAEPLTRGSPVVLDETRYRVANLGPSPFRDERPCAYLEPV